MLISNIACRVIVVEWNKVFFKHVKNKIKTIQLRRYVFNCIICTEQKTDIIAIFVQTETATKIEFASVTGWKHI